MKRKDKNERKRIMSIEIYGLTNWEPTTRKLTYSDPGRKYHGEIAAITKLGRLIGSSQFDIVIPNGDVHQEEKENCARPNKEPRKVESHVSTPSH